MAICIVFGIVSAEPVNGNSVKLNCEARTVSQTLEENFPFQFTLDTSGSNPDIQLRNFLSAYYATNYPGESLTKIITPGFGSINVN